MVMANTLFEADTRYVIIILFSGTKLNVKKCISIHLWIALIQHVMPKLKELGCLIPLLIIIIKPHHQLYAKT
jgi:hypothetical protein